MSLNFDATSNIIIIQGNSDNISTVNKLVDNIKATKFTIDSGENGDENSIESSAFTQVSTQLSGDNDKATFRVQMNFEPTILIIQKTF